MFLRICRHHLALLTVLAIGYCAGTTHAQTTDAEAEAKRLYDRANDFVTNIDESSYSYAYIQFYWKRAQNNLDRVLRVYPHTLTGKQLAADELKIGRFDQTYFKERVLPRLEEKRVAAFDAVNCAIFLYNLDEKRWDSQRVAALTSILEVLARQQRWNEALSFPVLDEHQDLLFNTILRVAARFQQQKVVDSLIKSAEENKKSVDWTILGEALALTGVPREAVAKFLDEHPEPEVRLAVLSGMIDREIAIQRAALRKHDASKGIQFIHYSVLDLSVRDDIDAVAGTFFPQPTPASSGLLAKYRAALGQEPKRDGPLAAHLAYLEHLALSDRFDELTAYVRKASRSSDLATDLALKEIELNAEYGRDEQVEKLRAAHAQAGRAAADAAGLASFRGQMVSTEKPLTVREKTFAQLPIEDPLSMAIALMEWSLTPMRSIRGAAPYDAVVQKYLPGFENLPLPKSDDVREASSTSKPF